MGARTALGAPLALSLAGHVALLGVLAGALSIAGAPPGPDAERVIAVQRARELPEASAARLRVAAGAAAAEAEAPDAVDAVIALDTADPRFRPYLAEVKRRIWRRWSAPVLPQGRTARGALVVEFTLTRSGRLAASEVRETSGVPALDRAALAAVARAVPFTPLPASVVGASMRVRARFVYD